MPEYKQNGGRLELNLDTTDQQDHQRQQQQRNRRASSIEEVEKKVPKAVDEENDAFVAQPKPTMPVKRPLRRESSWRQVSFLYWNFTWRLKKMKTDFSKSGRVKTG